VTGCLTYEPAKKSLLLNKSAGAVAIKLLDRQARCRHQVITGTGIYI
jgi:hypothetical protein